MRGKGLWHLQMRGREAWHLIYRYPTRWEAEVDLNIYRRNNPDDEWRIARVGVEEEG